MSAHYDAQESADNAAACAQIAYDQLQMEDALYCAVMTCSDAGDTRLDEYLPLICRANGLQYPPRQLSQSTPLFTLHTKAHYEHSDFGSWNQRKRQVNQLAQS